MREREREREIEHLYIQGAEQPVLVWPVFGSLSVYGKLPMVLAPFFLSGFLAFWIPKQTKPTGFAKTGMLEGLPNTVVPKKFFKSV